jgi:3'-5' exonuclease
MSPSPKTLVFDIEVAGFPWDEVDEPTQRYLLKRARNNSDREAIPERTGLYPGLGTVIAIGVWCVEDAAGTILLEGDGPEEPSWAEEPGTHIFRGDEAALLTRFWEMIEDRGGDPDQPPARVVTFNGRGYDGPMLMVRSAQLGVVPSRNLVPNRYGIHDHCDLFDVLTFMGSTRDRYSLDYWCRRFDVESSKGSIDGSQVAGAYREGRINEIGQYCMRDVRATAQLYEKLAPTILPLFKGGPDVG